MRSSTGSTTTESPPPAPIFVGAISVNIPSAAGHRSQSDRRQVPHPLTEPVGFFVSMR
jgi:hypothetical protein